MCEHLGVNRSEFLSWPIYDQQQHLAFRLDRRERCSNCGTRHDEWVNPETKRRWPTDTYEAQVKRCYGCETLAKAEPKDRADKPVLVPKQPKGG